MAFDLGNLLLHFEVFHLFLMQNSLVVDEVRAHQELAVTKIADIASRNLTVTPESGLWKVALLYAALFAMASPTELTKHSLVFLLERKLLTCAAQFILDPFFSGAICLEDRVFIVKLGFVFADPKEIKVGQVFNNLILDFFKLRLQLHRPVSFNH